jgi:hypothetical protein
MRKRQSNRATSLCPRARARKHASSPALRAHPATSAHRRTRRTRMPTRACDRLFVRCALGTVRNVGRPLVRRHMLCTHPPAGCAALRHWAAIPSRRHAFPSPYRAMALTGPTQTASPPRAGYKRSALSFLVRAPEPSLRSPLLPSLSSLLCLLS